METTVLLADKTPFAEGGCRKCYIHPRDSGKCLKIPKPEYVAEKIAKKARRRLNRLRVLSRPYRNSSIQEGRAYLYLEALGFPEAYRHIPRFYGFCDTDLGSAICTQMMRGYDGAVAPTLEVRALQGADDSLRNAMAEFSRFARRLLSAVRPQIDIPGIVPDCFSNGNLLVVPIADGRERIVICDYRHYAVGYRNLSCVKERKDRLHLAEMEARFARHFC